MHNTFVVLLPLNYLMLVFVVHVSYHTHTHTHIIHLALHMGLCLITVRTFHLPVFMETPVRLVCLSCPFTYPLVECN
jgi:hypothetical protein